MKGSDNMKLNSFVITVKDFLLVNQEVESKFNFFKLQYVIPKYQREYKWNKEKIKTFCRDILNRDKFIGNIILNKVNNSYEIVDGQQRLTTILLILVGLFNHNINNVINKLSDEQKEILTYLSNDELHSNIVIKNKSIGKYLLLNQNKILIDIKEYNDIYYQKDKFDEAYKCIAEELNSIQSSIEFINFLRKLLACKLSILVGEKEDENDSIEDLFLDINFKSQLLDVENIFKGYCFKNYFASSHDELKEQWIEIKRIMKEFEEIGYNNTTSGYFYLYLLSLDKESKITQELTIDGKHFLDNKSPTETRKIISDMIDYGNDILAFIRNLKRSDYLFEDICDEFKKYKSNNSVNNVIKKQFLDIILYKGAQYYKLPLFMFIHHLKMKEDLRKKITYSDIRRIVSNYYVYAFLFLSKRKDKSKDIIDRNIFKSLEDFDNRVIEERQCINDIVFSVKKLRKIGLDDYIIFKNYDDRKAYAFYSILDNYLLNSNYLDFLYTKEDYTKEHLIIHNNKNAKIIWSLSPKTIRISVKELLDNVENNGNNINSYKKMTSNYILLPKALNETLGHKNIVDKITVVKEYYLNRNKQLPRHIQIFFNFIENMPEYKELEKIKQENVALDIIKNKYKKFLNAYFNNENQEILYVNLENAFKNTFKDEMAP